MTHRLTDLHQADAPANADRPAIRVGDREITHGELHERIGAAKASLERIGAAGRRVGLLLPNVPAFPIVFHGLTGGGGSALLLNPASSAREIGEQIEDAGVDSVVTTERLAAQLPGSVRRILTDDWADRLDEGTDDSPRHGDGAERPADEAAVIFTAAMRGRSRGASLSQRNLGSNVTATFESIGISADDRVVGALPYAHAFGLTVCMNAPLVAGGLILPLPRFSPMSLMDLLAGGGVTVLAGVPAIFIAMIAVAERRGVPSHDLRVAICGGAAVSIEVLRRWEELFGMPLRQGYGLTEAAPVCLFNHVDHPNRIGTMGRAFPGVGISVRDLEGTELPEGEVGELCIQGENVFGGYIDDPSDPTVFHGDWLRTGDLATMEGESVRFRGLLKPMFTRNGFNVYPEEVRRALRNDPRVEDVMVLARPDPVRETEIVLVVRPRGGVELGEAEVREICQARLAAYKQPGEIRFDR
jgi:long-chain acyl-CoA synthetase